MPAKKDNRLIIIGAAAAILVIGGIILGLNLKTDESGRASQARLLSEEKSFDFGTISMTKGKVNHAFKIKNNGVANLKINNIDTSCMCTSAVLEKNGKVSPSFGMPGMSGDNPAFWSEELGPGESANLIVIFDPAAHGPEGVGLAIREINVYSNDPAGKTGFKITANVTP